jgi:hypothetical protein
VVQGSVGASGLRFRDDSLAQRCLCFHRLEVGTPRGKARSVAAGILQAEVRTEKVEQSAIVAAVRTHAALGQAEGNILAATLAPAPAQTAVAPQATPDSNPDSCQVHSASVSHLLLLLRRPFDFTYPGGI